MFGFKSCSPEWKFSGQDLKTVIAIVVLIVFSVINAVLAMMIEA